jgi:membrane protease subunit HflK
MAWNEPGNNGGKDPWGNDDSPPDLDEALKRFQEKLGGIFGGGGNGSGSGDGISGQFLGFALGILVAIWAMFGVYQLDEQEKAVVLHFGAFKEVVGPGLHWNPPVIDSVYPENVTRVRTFTTKGKMLTEDENIVLVELSVQYNVFDLKKFIVDIREPERALQQAADSALRHVVGGSGMDDVLTIGREVIATDVKERLQDYLDLYNTGIDVITVNVEQTQPPAEVQAAFDDVIKAREDEQRVQNEAQAYVNQVVPEARGQAKRMLEEAKAYREDIIARSEGEADRFEKMLREYRKAPTVTRERLYLDTVQIVMENSSKVMVDVEGGNNMMYLPLDKLMDQRSGYTPGNTGGSLADSDIDKITNQVIEKLERLRKEATSNLRRREVR